MQDIFDDYRPRPASPTSVPEPAVAAIDALQRAVLLAEARVVTIAAPRGGANPAAIARMLAANLAASGVRTLLVDASGAAGRPSVASDWSPGQPLTEDMIDKARAIGAPDEMTFSATRHSRPGFNHIERLRQAFRVDLSGYDAIVLHVAPVLASGEQHINPISLARATDVTFLVCTSDETTVGELQKSQSELETAGVKIAGTVLDASGVTPTGQEMAGFAQKWLPLPARWRHRLAERLRTSPFFNELP